MKAMDAAEKGKPIAEIVPIEMAEKEDPLAVLYFGPIEINSDIVAPATLLEDWKALK